MPEAHLAACMAKAYCSDAYRYVSGEGIQIHGGIGFTWEHDMHLYFKRAKGSEVTFGDATWNRELVAQVVLDQPEADRGERLDNRVRGERALPPRVARPSARSSVMTDRQILYFDDVAEGAAIPPFVVENLTRTDLVRYAGASGDFNPIHHDQTFAERAGLADGFRAWDVERRISQQVRHRLRRSREPAKIPGALRHPRVAGRYGHVQRQGDTKYEELGRKLIDGDLQVINQKGEVAIQGSFTAELPARLSNTTN